MFHAQIKAVTDENHRAAEESKFIVDLMSGQSSMLNYYRYMAALAPIYAQMEAAFQERSPEGILQYFDHRALDRFNKIESDLDFLAKELDLPEDWSEKNQLNSTNTYLARITPETSDARLLAHHYIRYLGDLSGGRIIGRMLQKHYSLPSEAMNFYNFDEIGDPVFYKRRYRDLLNLIPLSEIEQEEFLDEVVILYGITRAIFEELEKTSQPVA